MTFDSKDEEYFYYYLKELEKKGLVSDIEMQKTFIIFPGIKLNSKHSIRKKSYTPDFIFKIDPLLADYFYVNTDGLCYVDVKGEYTLHLNSSKTFPDRQAMMWSMHNIYVQKLIVHAPKSGKCLFTDTFAPAKFINNTMTKSKKPLSKNKYNYKRIKSFIDGLQTK